MSDTSKPKPEPSAKDRLRAEALRANLLRRKAQARERNEADPPLPPKPGADA